MRETSIISLPNAEGVLYGCTAKKVRVSVVSLYNTSGANRTCHLFLKPYDRSTSGKYLQEVIPTLKTKTDETPWIMTIGDQITGFADTAAVVTAIINVEVLQQ